MKKRPAHYNCLSAEPQGSTTLTPQPTVGHDHDRVAPTSNPQTLREAQSSLSSKSLLYKGLLYSHHDSPNKTICPAPSFPHPSNRTFWQSGHHPGSLPSTTQPSTSPFEISDSNSCEYKHVSPGILRRVLSRKFTDVSEVLITATIRAMSTHRWRQKQSLKRR